jgi:hypothetical protein
MIAKFLIAAPGLLLAIVPMICGMIALSGVVLLAGRVLTHILFTIKTWFKPHIQHVHLTDHEIETRYREMDIKKNGYNPMRHDFHIKELFPKKPELAKISAAAKLLFPHRHHQLVPKNGKDDYHIARQFLTNMAVERHHQLTAGQWSEAKQKQWVEMPYLPEVMREVDEEFVNWCFLAVGREKAEHYAS